MDGLVIRPLRKEDREAVYALWATGFQERKGVLFNKVISFTILRVLGVVGLISSLLWGGLTWLGIVLGIYAGLYYLFDVWLTRYVNAMIWKEAQKDMVDAYSYWILMKPRGSSNPPMAATTGEIKPRTFWVAVDSTTDQLVGCLGIRLHDRKAVRIDEGTWRTGRKCTHEECSSMLSCKTATIWRLAVHNSMRRQGLGKKLMEVAEAYAKEHGMTRVILYTGNAIAKKFYDNLGYQRKGEDIVIALIKVL